MAFGPALVVSVALSVFFALCAYEIRKSKIEEYYFDYKLWWDYLFIYGWVLVSAACAVLISWDVRS